jgi:hypothetical protein
MLCERSYDSLSRMLLNGDEGGAKFGGGWPIHRQRYLLTAETHSAWPLGTADMTDGSDAPDVKIIPPLVYLAGIVISFLVTIWMPTKVIPNSVAWTVGAILICCGAVPTGSTILKFKDVGTAVRPHRAASTLEASKAVCDGSDFRYSYQSESQFIALVAD